MSQENLIPLSQLCVHYKVEMSFFSSLSEYGLIEISTIEQALFVEEEKAAEIEKIIRLHNELDINLEGIDTILHLLNKIEALQAELSSTKNRLRLYEL